MRHSSRQRFSPFQPVLPFLFSLPHPLRPHRRKHRMIHPPPPPATFSSTPEASVVRRDAKNGRARPGYFINISFRCLSLPRCSGGAARQRRRPASGHRYPLPPPPSTRSGHTRRAKRGGEGEKESLEKKGRQIYIYIYIERRGGGAASLERGRGALYYIERRNVAAEIVSSPSSHPSPANKDEVSANIILVTGYSLGETTTSLYIHRPLHRWIVPRVFWNSAALDAFRWITVFIDVFIDGYADSLNFFSASLLAHSWQQSCMFRVWYFKCVFKIIRGVA